MAVALAPDKADDPFHAVTHLQRRLYLHALAETGGNVTRACEIAGVSRGAPYSRPWREDEVFQAHLPVAEEMATAALEAEAVRRAHDGVTEPVGWYKGKPGGYVQRYSDNLLMFTLKGRLPDKYRDRLEVRGAIAHVDLTQLPPDLLARIAGGEHPLSVLASAADALALGPGVEVGEGEAPAGEDGAHIEDGGDGTNG